MVFKDSLQVKIVMLNICPSAPEDEKINECAVMV
jgi:hypothetical protein